MLCQNCSKREATTHIKRVVNGEATEAHLCQECAAKLGYDNFFDNFSLNLPDLFSSFFGDSARALAGSRTDRCEKCGCSFDDIVKTGMVGCADCYDKFLDKLLPSIQRIHGRTRHVGSVPVTVTETTASAQSKPETAEDRIAALEAEMKKAIEAQNFEQAAVLRDKIKELKEDK